MDPHQGRLDKQLFIHVRQGSMVTASKDLDGDLSRTEHMTSIKISQPSRSELLAYLTKKVNGGERIKPAPTEKTEKPASQLV